MRIDNDDVKWVFEIIAEADALLELAFDPERNRADISDVAPSLDPEMQEAFAEIDPEVKDCLARLAFLLALEGSMRFPPEKHPEPFKSRWKALQAEARIRKHPELFKELSHDNPDRTVEEINAQIVKLTTRNAGGYERWIRPTVERLIEELEGGSCREISRKLESEWGILITHTTLHNWADEREG